MPQAEIDGVQLAYEVHGAGEPVVLVCGTGQGAYSWEFLQVPAFTSAGYQVLTFDNRGMAPSSSPPPPYTVFDMVQDLAGLIDMLELSPCRVVGYSLGAFVTQELALARPDLVRQAVMVGTLGRQDAFRRAIFRAWVELDESGVELPRFYDTVSAAFALFSPYALEDEEGINLYIEGSMAVPPWTGPGKLGQHQADYAYDDRIAALAGVRVPSLVIGFELDMLTPPKLCREVADVIPDCRYVQIERAGHAGVIEKHDELNSRILEFFSDSPSSSGRL